MSEQIQQADIQVQKPHKVVWVISDGIPGHFNQSKGILLALEQLYALQVEWISVKLKSGAYRRILSALLNRFNLSLTLFPVFYKATLPVGQTPDIVIGAGGRTSFAVAWLGQCFKAKNIFSGSLRGLKSSLFSAVLILEHSEQPEVITMPVSPMPVNQQRLQQAAQTWRDANLHAELPLWAILIGGDGAGAVYQDTDWQDLAQQLNMLAETYQIRWLVSTSRRTGAHAEQVLQRFINPTYIADAIWWSNEPRPVMATYLGLAQRIVCTADSMSMIMESISAMRPVFVIQPQQYQPDQQYANAIQQLVDSHLIYAERLANFGQKMNHCAQLKTLELEPSLWLASKLKERL